MCVSSAWRVQTAIINDVWNGVSHRQRGGLQVPPQHADGEEATPALQGRDEALVVVVYLFGTKNTNVDLE